MVMSVTRIFNSTYSKLCKTSFSLNLPIFESNLQNPAQLFEAL